MHSTGGRAKTTVGLWTMRVHGGCALGCQATVPPDTLGVLAGSPGGSVTSICGDGCECRSLGMPCSPRMLSSGMVAPEQANHSQQVLWSLLRRGMHFTRPRPHLASVDGKCESARQGGRCRGCTSAQSWEPCPTSRRSSSLAGDGMHAQVRTNRYIVHHPKKFRLATRGRNESFGFTNSPDNFQSLFTIPAIASSFLPPPVRPVACP